MGAKKASTETTTKRASKSKQAKEAKVPEDEVPTSELADWTAGHATDIPQLSALFEHIAQREFEQRERHHHQLMDKLDTVLTRLDKLGAAGADAALRTNALSITSTLAPPPAEPGTPKPAQSERATKKKAASASTAKRASSRGRKPKKSEAKNDAKEIESAAEDVALAEEDKKSWADMMEEHDQQTKERGHGPEEDHDAEYDHEHDHDADDVLTDYSHDKHNGHPDNIPHPVNAEGHTIPASALKNEDIDQYLRTIMPQLEFEPARKELSRFLRSQCSPIAKHLAAQAPDNQVPTYHRLDEEHKQHLIRAAIPHAAALGLPTTECMDNWLINHFVQAAWNSKARSQNRKSKADDAVSV